METVLATTATRGRLLRGREAIVERRRLVGELYLAAGLSAEAIAVELDVSAQTVLNDLDYLDIQKRPHGPRPGSGRHVSAPEEAADRRAQVSRLHHDGLSDARIARELGVSKTTVGKDLRLQGVGRRPPGRRPESPLPRKRRCEWCEEWFRPTRSQVLRDEGRFCSLECMAHDPKRREASRRKMILLHMKRRVELERLKSERDLLETHEVAELCGVKVATVIQHYAARGLLEVEKVEIRGLPYLLFPRADVDRLVRDWRRGASRQRRQWLDPDFVVSVHEATGFVEREACRTGLMEDDVKAYLRDRVRRRVARLPSPRGRPRGEGPPDYHFDWAQMFVVRKAELETEYDERRELGLLLDGERPPTKSNVALAVAESDFRLHPERWPSYEASPSDPRALHPGYRDAAEKRVWKAVKPLLDAETENPLS